MIRSGGHKIRLTYGSLILCTVFFLMILEFNFYQLNAFLSYLFVQVNADYNKTLIAVMSAACFLLLILNKKAKKLYTAEYLYFNVINLAFFFFIVLETFFAVIRYGQSPFDIFAEMRHYYILLMAFPICYGLEKCRDSRKILDLFLALIFVYVILIFLQAMVYNTSSFWFLNGYISEKSFRDGSLRIGLGSLAPFLLLYSFSCCCDSGQHFRKRCTALIVTVVTVGAYVYCTQTRALNLALGGAMLAILMVAKYRASKKTILLYLLAMGIFFCFYQGIFSELVYSLFFDQSKSSSALGRLYSIKHYLRAFYDNPVFGTGIIRETNLKFAFIKHGSDGLVYSDDVGVIGLIGENGIIGLIFYSLILFRLLYLTYEMVIKKKVWNTDTYFMAGMSVFLILTSATLIITNTMRIFLCPFLLAFYEYYGVKVHERKVKE